MLNSFLGVFRFVLYDYVGLRLYDRVFWNAGSTRRLKNHCNIIDLPYDQEQIADYPIQNKYCHNAYPYPFVNVHDCVPIF